MSGRREAIDSMKLRDARERTGLICLGRPNVLESVPNRNARERSALLQLIEQQGSECPKSTSHDFGSVRSDETGGLPYVRCECGEIRALF